MKKRQQKKIECEYWSVKEVGGKLGVCDDTVLSLIADRKLSALKVGRAWRIRKDKLQRFEYGYNYSIASIKHDDHNLLSATLYLGDKEYFHGSLEDCVTTFGLLDEPEPFVIKGSINVD